MAIVRFEASTGQYFVNLVSVVLDHLKLDKDIKYARLLQRLFSNDHLSHPLMSMSGAMHMYNLVLPDTTQTVIESVTERVTVQFTE